jgi:hypothetical protein
MIRTASDLILLIVTAARGVEESGLDLTDDPLETSSLSLASPVIIASPSQKVISLYPELSLLVLVLRRVCSISLRNSDPPRCTGLLGHSVEVGTRAAFPSALTRVQQAGVQLSCLAAPAGMLQLPRTFGARLVKHRSRPTALKIRTGKLQITVKIAPGNQDRY